LPSTCARQADAGAGHRASASQVNVRQTIANLWHLSPPDQLLGRRPAAEEVQAPFDVRIWRRLRVVEKLSPADRNAVIKYAEALARGAGQKNDDEAA
jgi:hypothetical protein